MACRRLRAALWTLIVVAACAGLGAPPIVHALDDEHIYKDLDKFVRGLRLVDEAYVEPVDGTEMIEGALQGMLSQLDPHSMYLPKEIFEEFKTDTTGKFGGVGIEITVRDGLLTIISPIDGTPASRAGLEPGDVIVRIDTVETRTMTMYDAIEKMRGPIGESIAFTIYRPKTKKTVVVTLIREVINIKSVIAEWLGEGMAIIQIRSFQEETASDFKQAMATLSSEHPEGLSGIVLDLRNNPGGLLDQAIQIADVFIEKGVIVSIKDRSGKAELKKATAAGTVAVPVITLINEGSASASEILAGALQDYGKGPVIGETSFGKGSVQTVIELPDGLCIKLTLAHYSTSKGRFI